MKVKPMGHSDAVIAILADYKAAKDAAKALPAAIFAMGPTLGAGAPSNGSRAAIAPCRTSCSPTRWGAWRGHKGMRQCSAIAPPPKSWPPF